MLTGGTLIDGTGALPLANAALAIRGGRIVARGPAGELVYGPDTPVRDLAGATILPGFINASPRDRIPDDLIGLMVARGVALVPTIDVYEALAESRGLGADWRRLTAPVMYNNLRRFAAAGGTLALGDDYGGAPGMTGGMPLAEIEHWLRAGISPMELIVAATRGGSIVCGLEAEIGTLEIGKRADILVVDGDPLQDISALGRPLLVLRDGVAVQ